MKQVLLALVITAFAYTSAEAQTPVKCETAAPKPKAVVKQKSAVKSTTKTTTKVTACRMLPYQVCTILPDRRSVSCYTTTDAADQTKTGETTYYGPTGPMPGEVVHFKVRTVVVKGPDKANYCKRNKVGNATVCYEPGLLLRDENGYYSYGEGLPQKTRRITVNK